LLKAGEEKREPEPVKHEILKTGYFDLYMIDENWKDEDKYPLVRVYSDSKSLKKDWLLLLSQKMDTAPDIDFKKHRALIAISPPRPDSHTEFELKGAFETEKGIELRIQANRKEGVGLTVMLSPNYWVLTIPKGDQKVYVEEVDE
jgi:hypothetical protein